MYDTADSILAQKLAQVDGVGQVFICGSAPASGAGGSESHAAQQAGSRAGHGAQRAECGQREPAKGQVENNTTSSSFSDNDQLFTADEYRPLIVAYNNGAPVRLGDVADVQDSVADVHNLGLANGKPGVLDHYFPAARRQRHRDCGPRPRSDALSPVLDFSGYQTGGGLGPHDHGPGLGKRH